MELQRIDFCRGKVLVRRRRLADWKGSGIDLPDLPGQAGLGAGDSRREELLKGRARQHARSGIPQARLRRKRRRRSGRRYRLRESGLDLAEQGLSTIDEADRVTGG